MSAPQRRPALELVPDTAPADDTTTAAAVDVEAPETWQAETVLAQWEPEHQLIGALMWLTAAQAKPIIELIPDTAIWRPTIRWAYQIIRSLVEAGTDPNPVVVPAAAKQRPCSEADHTPSERTDARAASQTRGVPGRAPTASALTQGRRRRLRPRGPRARPTAAGSPKPASGCSSSANAAPNLKH